ncbi:sigma 54-interacting transcriptional regulator [Rhodovulum marinum]|uniref:Nif-specific regulatory protein n=1 Tax=Rhodovulum marinum TaxID=320662 RepID=A0A4R2PXI7_9RHOB|nr:sigma 54-interacting transcriptional regulator [Rhodovulum marinum]TCP40004.1 PAS domain S-box-containing protein [Rhodovulum marinum]
MPQDLPSPDSLLALAPVPALLLDPARDEIVEANAAACTLFETGTLVGRRFLPLTGLDKARFLVFADEIAHRSSAWSRDISLKGCAGGVLACEIRGQIAGTPQAPRLLLSFIDLAEMERRTAQAEAARLQRAGIHEWQRAQGFFSELERQNQLILNAAGEGIYGVNADGKTTFVNRAAQEMLGWSAEDLLGEDIHARIHHHHLNGEVYPSRDCPIYRSFRYEQVNRIEDEVFWRKDGRPIRVEYVSTPIYDQKILVGAVVIFRDITERWEAERRLREALAEVADLRDRLEQENAYLQEEITSERAHHDIIGTSPPVRHLLAQIALVAGTDTNVVITGEPGTGKALVASAIHGQSGRRRRPLVHFRCGAVSPEMIESELFGHMRGAFASALRDKPGKLELAHGSTLFLDDVAEIPLEQQGRLLNALTERSITRMGDSRARDIDVRVIAATDRDLQREVAAGRFREDLYFYLNVFPIFCTPLRDRPTDIPLLATHLLRIACKKLNRPEPVITKGTMQTLCAYPWPGNVRELGNVIERGAIVSTGHKLIVEMQSGVPARAGTAAPILTEAEIEEMRVANLIACLRETGGKVSGPDGAAALLGMRPTTLYSRIKALGLTEAAWR